MIKHYAVILQIHLDLIPYAVLEINFWVWSSAGPVGCQRMKLHVAKESLRMMNASTAFNLFKLISHQGMMVKWLSFI